MGLSSTTLIGGLEDRASGETEGWITEQRGSFEEYLRKLGPLAWLEKRVHEFSRR